MKDRTQFLTLQECKRVFYRLDYGVMRCHDMIANPEDFHLCPVFVLGVSIAGLPTHFHRYFLASDSPSVSGFLHMFWLREYQVNCLSQEDCPLPSSIHGKPDLLVIDHRLSACLKSNFYDWLNAEGVRYEFSEGKNKQFVATVRQYQDFPYTHMYGEPFPSEKANSIEPYPLTVDLLNKTTNYLPFLCGLTPKQRQFISEHYQTPMLSPVLPTVPGDVLLLASELSVKSVNEVTADTALWCAAKPKNEDFGYIEITTSDERFNEEDDDNVPEWVYYHKELLIALHCSESVNALMVDHLKMYFGDHNYPRKFEQLKKSNFKRSPFSAVEELVLYDWLRLENFDFIEWRQLGSDPLEHLPGIFDISNLSAKETELLWNKITWGGDIEISFEIRPQNGFDDPAYRLFYINRLDDYWFLAHRASKACAALDKGNCLNFSSDKAKFFNPEIYRQMLKAVVKWDRLLLMRLAYKHCLPD